LLLFNALISLTSCLVETKVPLDTFLLTALLLENGWMHLLNLVFKCPLNKQKKATFKKKYALATWDDVDETYQDLEEEANMCLNAEYGDEKSIEVNKPNCCLLHEQLENDFENLRNEERFFTNKCVYFAKIKWWS